jgi:hypothetical protein
LRELHDLPPQCVRRLPRVVRLIRGAVRRQLRRHTNGDHTNGDHTNHIIDRAYAGYFLFYTVPAPANVPAPPASMIGVTAKTRSGTRANVPAAQSAHVGTRPKII